METVKSVSVIVPCYNVQHYLRECLDSIKKQTLENFEIICIDDGSTDDTLQILKTYESDIIRVIHQKNSGVAIARNNGIRIATGKYVCFIDSDDYYPNEFVLEKLYKAAIENNVKICGGSFSKDKGYCIQTTFEGIYTNYTFNENKLWKYEDYQFDYGYHRFLYDRKMLVDNEIFYPEYIRFQDPPFFVKAMITAKEFYAISDVVYCYRWGHQSLDWNEKRTNHVLNGLCDILRMSNDNNLAKLHTLTLTRLLNDYKKPILKNIEKKSIQDLLKQVQLLINDALLEDLSLKTGIVNLLIQVINLNKQKLNQKELEANLDNERIINNISNKIKSNKDALYRIKNSLSFKVGRAITFIPRKIRGAVRILHKKGVKGLLKRICRKK